MLLRIIALLFFVALPSAALAATCPVTSLQVKDNNGVTANMSVADDGTGNGTCQTFGEASIVTAIKQPPGLGISGGWTPFFKAALSTTVTAVKTSAGQLGFIQCDNGNAVYEYVQIFNLATGSVTLGTTAPTQVLPIPGNLSNGFVMNLVGMQYSTAISVAATTTATGNGAPGTALNCSFGFN